MNDKKNSFKEGLDDGRASAAASRRNDVGDTLIDAMGIFVTGNVPGKHPDGTKGYEEGFKAGRAGK